MYQRQNQLVLPSLLVQFQLVPVVYLVVRLWH